MPEAQFPVSAGASPAAPTALDAEQDLEAALHAAGGGRGADVDENLPDAL
jgi:hypothetical protein